MYILIVQSQISVYDHKLLIWNAGQLPPDWSPANPNIARALFLAGKKFKA